MSPRLLPWRPHLALLAWILVVCLVHATSHQSQQSLEAKAADTSASPEQRVAAMRLLSTRANATRSQVQALSETARRAKEPLLRALAAGSDLLRFGAEERRGPPPVPPAATEATLQQLGANPSPSAEEWLWFVLYRRQVGGMQLGANCVITSLSQLMGACPITSGGKPQGLEGEVINTGRRRITVERALEF